MLNCAAILSASTDDGLSARLRLAGMGFGCQTGVELRRRHLLKYQFHAVPPFVKHRPQFG
jgi:hypothetical protein